MKKNVILTVMLAMAFMACARPAVDVDSLARTQRVVLDISRYQGEDINFEKVMQSSKWIYIKATEGMNVDPLFISDIKRAKDAKMLVSGYLFFSERSGARDQAYKFISTVKSAGVDLDLIPMVDVERISIYSNSPARLTDSVAVVIRCLAEEFKCKPLIYSGERFFLDYLQDLGKDYPLWIAKYGPKPPNLGGIDYVLWQRTEEGIVNGINTRVDVSTFNDGHHPREIKLPSSSQGEKKNTSKSSKKDKKKSKGGRQQDNP